MDGWTRETLDGSPPLSLPPFLFFTERNAKKNRRSVVMGRGVRVRQWKVSLVRTHCWGSPLWMMSRIKLMECSNGDDDDDRHGQSPVAQYGAGGCSACCLGLDGSSSLSPSDPSRIAQLRTVGLRRAFDCDGAVHKANTRAHLSKHSCWAKR